MKTQQDTQVRMVALENLTAMCWRISDTCHRFQIIKITSTRCHVQYSNPDEYGNPSPVVAVFPVIPSGWADDKGQSLQYPDPNPRVFLCALRYTGGRPEDESWQAFEQLYDCPTLWRTTHMNGKETWRSHLEIRHAGEDQRTDEHDTCVVCDLPKFLQDII